MFTIRDDRLRRKGVMHTSNTLIACLNSLSGPVPASATDDVMRVCLADRAA
mgnify:CR=1 FL=1